MSEHDEKSFDEVLDLIRGQHVAMLTTLDAGRPVSRPMGMQDPDDDGTLWFFCRSDADVADQVRADGRVNVSFADGDYVSVAGTASVVDDVAKKRELWDASVEAWMQSSPEDPSVALLRVAPETIGYWDTPGTVGSMVAMLGGLVSGKEPDVGDSGVVGAPGHRP